MMKNREKINASPFFAKCMLGTFLLICICILSGCDNETNVIEACEPLPVIDGYKIIKTKSNITLKLPGFADLRRKSNGDYGCGYVSDLFLDLLWYEGELISESRNRFKVPEGKRKLVKLYFKGAGDLEGARSRFKNDPNSVDKRLWVFDGAIPHKRFPLEYYPKFFWGDPETPSAEALQRERLDSVWGIRNTKYKNAHSDLPFIAFCSIAPVDKSIPATRIENDFSRYGSSGCRGHITAANRGKYLSFMIDVYAYLGSEQEGIEEINLIYNAAVEQLQSFIQE